MAELRTAFLSLFILSGVMNLRTPWAATETVKPSSVQRDEVFTEGTRVREAYLSTLLANRRRRAMEFEKRESAEAYFAKAPELFPISFHLRIDAPNTTQIERISMRVDDVPTIDTRLSSSGSDRNDQKWMSFRSRQVAVGQRFVTVTVETREHSAVYPFTQLPRRNLRENSTPVFLRPDQNEVYLSVSLRDDRVEVAEVTR